MKLYCHLRLPSVSTLIPVFLSTILSTAYEFSWRLLFLNTVGPQENHSAPFSWSQILGYDLGEKERKKKEDYERVKEQKMKEI